MKQHQQSTGCMARLLRWGRNVFLFGVGVVLVLLVSGLVYERIAEYLDEQQNPAPGKMVVVNGHNMHIFAKGSGKVTVVFGSGFGIPCPYCDLYPLYEEVSKTARVAVYDRPGYGWSEMSNTPRSIDTTTEEIHELLEKSGEKPPYILVGHSLAALEVIRFAQCYPDEVQGIVIIDGGNPTFYATQNMRDGALSGMNLKLVLNSLGVFRLLFDQVPSFYASAYAPRNHLALVPDELKRIDKALYLKTMVNADKSDEIDRMKANAEKVMEAGTLGAMPLRVLTSEAEAADANWKTSQEALKDWSTQGTQVIVPGTTHNMHQYAPQVIIDAISSILVMP